MNNKVQYAVGTWEKYSSLSKKDENTLYFITDKPLIFKGSVCYTNDFELVLGEFPLTGEAGILYIKPEPLEVRIYNEKWITVFTGNTEVKSNLKSIDTISSDIGETDTDVTTVKAVRDYFASQIKSLKVNVEISKEAKNALVSKSDGLFVPEPEVKIVPKQDNEVIVASSDGTLKASGITVGTGTLNEVPNDKTLATEAAVKAELDKICYWIEL